MSRVSLNALGMKNFFAVVVMSIIWLACSSFSTICSTNANCNTVYPQYALVQPEDDVIITTDRKDVCGLEYIGEIEVTEKWWFYHNNDLKQETRNELMKQAADKGGQIVYVDIKEKKGFGLFFTTTISGYVYKKL